MSKLRLVMLTTTALTLGQWVAYPAQADDARGASTTIRMAQAAPGDSKPEDRAKGRERSGPREHGREGPRGGPPGAPSQGGGHGAGAPPQRPTTPAAPAPHAAPPAPPAAAPQHTPPAATRPERPAAQPQPKAAPPAAPAAPKAPPPKAPEPKPPAPTPPAAGGAPHPSSAYGTPKAAPAAPAPQPPAQQSAPSGRQGSAPQPPAAAKPTYPSAYGTPKGAPAAAPSATPPSPTPGNQTAAPPQPAKPPQVSAPLPPPPPVADKVIAPGAQQGPRRIDDFRSERRETQQGGRTIITEPGRVIVRDPSGHSFIRHNEEDRFRYGARDIRQERAGNDTRTVVVRPDGTQIITVTDRDGRMLRRIRRDRGGQEIVIIDNDRHDHRGGRGGPGSIAAGVAAGMVAGAIGGYYVSLPPPRIGIPRDRYIVEAEDAPPDVIYETLMAPPVERIERAYTLDEVRYSPMVRARMPSIDLDTINFETGSWEIPPDQAAKLQVIADGINRAISRNPREVFLIEGHTDAVGSDVDNLSLSDRRAQSAAELLTQQFQVPPENLVTQGYGEQNLKVQTDGPSRENRRVTVRRITPLLNGGTASAAPPPPPRR